MSITSLIFALGFSAGIFLALFRSPFYGLCAYVAVFYLDPPGRWWAASLPELRWSFIMAAVTIVATLIHKSVPRRRWFQHGPIAIVIVYASWMWVQSLWAITGYDHSYGREIFTKYLIVLFLTYSLVNTKDRLIWFLMFHVLGCFYLSFIAWTTYGGGRLDGVGGPGINDSNSLGMQLGTGVICAVAIYFAVKDWRKWAAAFSIPFILNAIVMTGSRGAFLALVFGGAAMLYLRPVKQLKRIVPYLLLGLYLFAYVASDYFWDRIATVGVAVQDIEQADHSAASRIEVVRKQWEMAKRFPMGVGHKGTTALSYEYLDERYMSYQGGRSSHNSIMSALVDQGFPGLILWVGLMISLCRRSRTDCRRFRDAQQSDLGWINAALFGSLATYWVAGMFAPNLKAEVYMWLIALVCTIGHLLPEEALSSSASKAAVRRSAAVRNAK